MGSQDVDTAFLRFQTHGDPSALAQVFDSLAPRLLLLAAHLAPDPAKAEDLVQATFLSAIHSAGRWDAKRPVGTWLSGILRHKAIDAERKASNHTEAIPDSLGSEAPNPAQLAEQKETLQRVEAAIVELPSPYSEVLLLRLLHGLQPKAIAYSLGRSPSTVRMQLARGLETLRGKLPREYATLSLFSMLPTSNLPAIRDAILEVAEHGSQAGPLTGDVPGDVVNSVPLLDPITASSTSTRPLQASTKTPSASSGMHATLGGILMMKWALTAGIAAAALGWLFLRSERPAVKHPSVQTEQTVDSMAEFLDAPKPKLQAKEGTQRTTVHSELLASAPVTETTYPFEIRVLRRKDRAALPAVTLQVNPAANLGPPLRSRTDAFGLCLLEGLAEGEYEVQLDRADSIHRVSLPRTDPLFLFIEEGIEVTGRVLDLQGNPIPGAGVFRKTGNIDRAPLQVAIADEYGQYRIADCSEGIQLVARMKGYQPSLSESVWDDDEDRSTEIDITLGAVASSLTGQVFLPSGFPAAHAKVLIGAAYQSRDGEHVDLSNPAPFDAAKEFESFFVRCDEEGRYTTDQVPAGETLLIGRSQDRHSSTAQLVSVGRQQQTRSDLHLKEGAILRGVVLDLAGAPMPNMEIKASWRGDAVVGACNYFMFPGGAPTVRTANDGTYHLSGILAGRNSVSVKHARGFTGRHQPTAVLEDIEFERQQTQTWNPILPVADQLLLCLIDPEGKPLQGWKVSSHDQDGPNPRHGWQALRTDSEGRARLLVTHGIRPVSLTISPPPESFTSDEPVLRTVPIRSGTQKNETSETVVQILQEEIPTSSIRGRLLHPSGTPLPQQMLLLEFNNRAGLRSTWTDAKGYFSYPGVRSGNYSLSLDQSQESWTLLEFSIGTHQTLDLGALKHFR